MTATLLHHLVEQRAEERPQAPALFYREQQISYAALAASIQQFARQLVQLGLRDNDRVAVYLPKQPESVIAFFAASKARCVFVPINPVLKADQVKYILQHAGARVLITGRERQASLNDLLHECRELEKVILVEDLRLPFQDTEKARFSADSAAEQPLVKQFSPDNTNALAAILYTSGSTGFPKGVMLSHRNMLLGAASVAQYIGKNEQDRLLAVLPFSFDYGLSQLTTAFSVGASVVLMDYLFPRDVIRAVEKFQVTGVAAIPTLWKQLAAMDWPASSLQSLRYITNSGGAMPVQTTRKLQQLLANTRIYLMYGLTEAFRSTYLPPEDIDNRPESIGIPIPHARLFVIDTSGNECAPGTAGELVHAGPLVTLGYWNDPEKTAHRYKALPQDNGNTAVWSGDRVMKDRHGYFYFLGRMDEMIKTSGYRVSPTEVEAVAHDAAHHTHLAALGIPHPDLGEAIILVVEGEATPNLANSILSECKKKLPPYMQPLEIRFHAQLPLNANGKIDRPRLHREYNGLFDSIQSGL